MQESHRHPIVVAFVSNHIPRRDGSGTYTLALLSYLKQSGCLVEFVCPNDSPVGRKPWYIVERQMDGLVKLSLRRHLKLFNLCLRPWPIIDWLYGFAVTAYLALPTTVKTLYRGKIKGRFTTMNGSANGDDLKRDWDTVTADELRFARRKLLSIKPDVIIADYAWMADVLDAAGPETLKVISTLDVLHERTSSFKSHGMTPDLTGWDRDTEARLLAKGQVLLAIQEEEAETIRKMMPDSEVITVPLPVVRQVCRTAQMAGRCLFVGSGATHNVHGLDWFLREVWPMVLASVSWATLHVCGEICSIFGNPYPGVHSVGTVADLSCEYSAAQVCLIPVFMGSGLSIKLVEALSYGRACVSTRSGLRGLKELEGKGASVGDTPEAFAAAVCDILTDPRRRQAMEEEACKYVKERLSPEAVCQPFVDRIYRHIASRRQRAT